MALASHVYSIEFTPRSIVCSQRTSTGQFAANSRRQTIYRCARGAGEHRAGPERPRGVPLDVGELFQRCVGNCPMSAGVWFGR